ncbi:MAG: tRNA uridine-5-carboxymethylaminomethyl(34) synthesis GTPase MnmE [Metamycoplasmataceae bacterium]
MFDNIVAIASGNINQAISIIRISGPESFDIIKKIYTGKIGNDKTITYGFIVDENKNKIDEVLINFYKGNNNFVGEDTIEIMCHGGVLITNLIVNLIIENGARKANPGEFSRRAFLNGKIDLIKAEAINDLIHAKTIFQTKIAINRFENKSTLFIDKVIKDLEELIGICEVNIDYPEYDDVEKINEIKITKKLKSFIIEIDNIIKQSEENQYYSSTINVAIVGSPNAGKSALLNVILNEDKSIVTDIEGTTRDIVEGEIVYKNIILKFLDTAGIRATENEIEKIGIKKSLEAIEKSAIVFHIIDATKEISKNDILIEEKAKEKIYLRIFNKKDLIKNIKKDSEKNIYISALNKDIELIFDWLGNIFDKNKIEHDDWFFNQRETVLLKKANNAFKNALSSLENDQTYDVIIVDIYSAWENLKSIIGIVDKEDLLDSIFSKFCLGK